jgi:hypothetical protein
MASTAAPITALRLFLLIEIVMIKTPFAFSAELRMPVWQLSPFGNEPDAPARQRPSILQFWQQRGRSGRVSIGTTDDDFPAAGPKNCVFMVSA